MEGAAITWSKLVTQKLGKHCWSTWTSCHRYYLFMQSQLFSSRSGTARKPTWNFLRSCEWIFNWISSGFLRFRNADQRSSAGRRLPGQRSRSESLRNTCRDGRDGLASAGSMSPTHPESPANGDNISHRLGSNNPNIVAPHLTFVTFLLHGNIVIRRGGRWIGLLHAWNTVK